MFIPSTRERLLPGSFAIRSPGSLFTAKSSENCRDQRETFWRHVLLEDLLRISDTMQNSCLQFAGAA